MADSNGKSVEMKILDGTFKASRDPHPSTLLRPPVVTGLEVPACLDEDGKREWNRVVPILTEQGALTGLDVAGLTSYCKAFDEEAAADKVLSVEGITYFVNGMHRPRPELKIRADARKVQRHFMAAFGLVPSARKRMTGFKVVKSSGVARRERN